MIGNSSNNLLIKILRSLRRSELFRDNYWPPYVLDTLENEHHLRPDEMLPLWYVRERLKNSKHHDYRYALFIYNKVKANEKRIAIKNSTDLYANSDLLIFSGNLLVNGTVKLRKAGDLPT